MVRPLYRYPLRHYESSSCVRKQGGDNAKTYSLIGFPAIVEYQRSLQTFPHQPIAAAMYEIAAFYTRSDQPAYVRVINSGV
jgi:hypothetical protein